MYRFCLKCLRTFAFPITINFDSYGLYVTFISGYGDGD